MQKVFTPLLLICLLFVGACGETPSPSPYDQVQEETTQPKQTKQPKQISQEIHAGGDFNKFFPGDVNGYKRVYTSEKKGYAEAVLKKDGKVVATLAISDTMGDTSVASKFKGSDKIDGYPSAKQGKTKTSILVADRYQVTITSKTLSESDRKEILTKFNLNGLKNLK